MAYAKEDEPRSKTWASFEQTEASMQKKVEHGSKFGMFGTIWKAVEISSVNVRSYCLP